MIIQVFLGFPVDLWSPVDPCYPDLIGSKCCGRSVGSHRAEENLKQQVVPKIHSKPHQHIVTTGH